MFSLNVLFNNLILKYLNDAALAVYAVIINISTIVQCCGYGIGQAGQPILSTNFGAKRYDRISLTLKYNIIGKAIQKCQDSFRIKEDMKINIKNIREEKRLIK